MIGIGNFFRCHFHGGKVSGIWSGLPFKITMIADLGHSISAGH